MKSTNKDPYLHENGCLKNILQITDKEQLRKEEIKRFRKALRCVLAENHPFSIVATKNFYYELHHELFGAIYEWAGQPRVIDIGKPEHLLGGRSVAYTHFKAIDLNLDTIFDRMKRLKAIRLSQRKQSIADYVASLWWVHPFREGNTRMHTTYFALLSKSIGYSFDWATYAETLKAENIRDYFVLYTLDGEPRQRYYERLTSFLS